MNKNQIKLISVTALILLVFSVIAFAAPFARTGVFWLAYVFGVLAVLAQLYVMKAAFGKGTVRSRFYGFPIAGIGAVYLAAQLALSIVFMLLAAVVPLWVEIIVFVVLLAAVGIGLIAADTTRDEIEAQDRKLEENTSCMTTLRSIVYPLARQCDGAEERKRIEALSEEFRYSDPVSSPALEEIETELEKEVAALQIAVSEVKTAEILPLCKKVGDTLVERNRLCKLSKKN